ncbi:hypothetical protein D3C85_1225700 [compost metagenome]
MNGIRAFNEWGFLCFNLMLTGIVHHINCCNKCRHIISGFRWKIPSDLPKVLRIGFHHRPFHISHPTVIGRNSQKPVSQFFVSISEVSCRRITGLNGVFSLVYKIIHIQSIIFCRSKHELPKTRRTNPGHRMCIHRRLYDREVFNFLGNIIIF